VILRPVFAYFLDASALAELLQVAYGNGTIIGSAFGSRFVA